MLLDEPVHRRLKRAARKRVSRTGHRGQRRRNPVCQGMPDSWTSSPRQGSLSLESMGFDRGVDGSIYHRRHHTLPCLSLLSLRSGGCPVRHTPVGRYWQRQGGQASGCVYLRRSILFHSTKAQSLLSWLVEKKVIAEHARKEWPQVQGCMNEERLQVKSAPARTQGGEAMRSVNDGGRVGREHTSRMLPCRDDADCAEGQ
jgi:hypothetical protein